MHSVSSFTPFNSFIAVVQCTKTKRGSLRVLAYNVLGQRVDQNADVAAAAVICSNCQCHFEKPTTEEAL
jgi:hypothetical protein